MRCELCGDEEVVGICPCGCKRLVCEGCIESDPPKGIHEKVDEINRKIEEDKA